MGADEFQKAVLQGLESINHRMGGLEEGQKRLETRMEGVETRMESVETRQEGIEARLEGIETRQDEIFQVVKAIEHSNQVGRSELDNHKVRISKLEGKFKKVAKAFNEEAGIDKASSL